jgi:hypothetical protein
MRAMDAGFELTNALCFLILPSRRCSIMPNVKMLWMMPYALMSDDIEVSCGWGIMDGIINI